MKGFGLARTWLEADAFITLPVLKTHATTVFTGAIKNQWGCVPRYDRILLHKYLHELVGDLNKRRPVTLGSDGRDGRDAGPRADQRLPDQPPRSAGQPRPDRASTRPACG